MSTASCLECFIGVYTCAFLPSLQSGCMNASHWCWVLALGCPYHCRLIGIMEIVFLTPRRLLKRWSNRRSGRRCTSYHAQGGAGSLTTLRSGRRHNHGGLHATPPHWRSLSTAISVCSQTSSRSSSSSSFANWSEAHRCCQCWDYHSYRNSYYCNCRYYRQQPGAPGAAESPQGRLAQSVHRDRNTPDELWT